MGERRKWRLVCLGDEPYNPACRSYCEQADWMMCKAFCLYRDRDINHPYEKHHSTALEAGRLAQELGVRNLVLYHTEEDTGKDRKELYSQEVSQVFNGTVHVPNDLEIIKL